MSQLEKILIDYQDINIVTDNEKPSFSWRYKNTFKDEQESYQIIVKHINYKNDEILLWDSGVVKYKDTIGIKYNGLKLEPTKKYNVLLKTISSKKEVNEINSSFEMGLMYESEWHGRYIAMPANFSGGTLLFRTKFTLPNDKNVISAKAYIVGLGYHEFFVNGKKMGNSFLNPGFTEYSKRVLYVKYDIENLNKGDNVFGIELGYGWYGNRKYLGEFRFEFDDGTTLILYSNEDNYWVSGSPTIYNSIFGGETYDATLEEKIPLNWSTVDFEPRWDNGWMFPMYTFNELGKKELQTVEPIKVCYEYKEVSRTKVNDNTYLVDIGQNISGWIKISVKGERGSKVEIKYAEDILNGHANQTNLRSAANLDTYILKGKGIEEYHPRFTYHGFRYADIVVTGKVEIVSIIGQHVHSDTKVVGHFECSNDVLNKLHKNAQITEQNNEHSILTDCPQRDERCGWLNDLGSRIYQTQYNINFDNLFDKFISDITHSQRDDGAITDTAPYLFGGCPADPVCIAYLLFAKYNYVYYGDDRAINREYNNIKKWVDYLISRSNDYIMDYYYYADWVFPYKDLWADGIFVSTCYLNWHLKEMMNLSKIVNNDADYKIYKNHYLNSKKCINEKYFDKNTYNYSKGHQTENSLAVSLDLCDDEYKKKVVDNILNDIKNRNYHFTSGNIGYRHEMYSLADFGYSSDVLKVLINEEYPGWGYMIKNGATTVWERWEKEMGNIMNSFDHPMFGSYDAFFYHYLGGIKIGENSFASNDLVIEPSFIKELQYVNSSYDSIRGKIVSNWKRENGNIIVHIEVPYGVNAKFKYNNQEYLINNVFDLEFEDF